MRTFARLPYKLNINEISYSGSDSSFGNQFDSLRGFNSARSSEDEDAKKIESLRLEGSIASHCFVYHDRCPICRTKKTASLLFTKYSFKHYQCPECQSIYVSPSLSQKYIIENFYSDNFYPFLAAVNSEVQDKYDIKRFDDLIPAIAHGWEPNFNLLDLGCGGGLFLQRCSSLKSNPYGVDCLLSAVKHAQKKFNINVAYSSAIDFLESSSLQYHAVIALELLDHVVEPLQLLAAISSKVKTGGMFIMSVRNSLSLAVEILNEACPMFLGHLHLNFWSPSCLSSTLAEYGFEIEFMYSYISYLPTLQSIANTNKSVALSLGNLKTASPQSIVEEMKGYKLVAGFRKVSSK